MEFGEQPQSAPPLPLTKSAYRALRQFVRHAASDTLGSEQTITPQQHLFGRPVAYGTHSLRWTRAALIYRKTGNLRAVQLLLGHTKVDSAVRYLGVELDDALSIAESIEI